MRQRLAGGSMSITLTPELEELICRKVQSGLYSDTNEVVEAALRLLDERDRMTRLRALIAVADAEIARGETVEWTPDFMQLLMQEADEEDRQGLPIDDVVQP